MTSRIAATACASFAPAPALEQVVVDLDGDGRGPQVLGRREREPAGDDHRVEARAPHGAQRELAVDGVAVEPARVQVGQPELGVAPDLVGARLHARAADLVVADRENPPSADLDVHERIAREEAAGGELVGVREAVGVEEDTLGHLPRVAVPIPCRVMSFARYEQAIELLETHRAAILDLIPEGCPVVDVHTHLGRDEDGSSLSLEDHLASMERNHVDTSVVFALNDPERVPAYRVPNDRVLAWAAESDGKLVPFVRLALDGDDPVREAARCIDRGARGIKLHPRSQAFSVTDPRLEAVFVFASERRLPVLIHAGRGLPPGLGEELARVAGRHPEASLILAHAAIADQAAIASFACGMPNVFFDTSTWSPLDLLSLLGRVGPEQVLFASDIPYGDQFYHQYLTLGALRRVGLHGRRGARGARGDRHASARGRAARERSRRRAPMAR